MFLGTTERKRKRNNFSPSHILPPSALAPPGGWGPLTAERSFVRTKPARQRGLGTVSTPVAGSLVLSSDPIARTTTPVSQRMPINIRFPVPGWHGVVRITAPNVPANPYGWTAANSPYGSSPTNPSGSQLAVAQALLQTNPSLLNPTQWQMLQQAGLVASTVPYSSASQVNPAVSSAIDPATGIPYSQELASAQAGAIDPSTGIPYSQETGASSLTSGLSTTYGGLPLYVWLLLGGGAFVLFSSKGRR